MSNKEKLFTEEDMYKAFQFGGWMNICQGVEDVEGALKERTGYKSFEDLINKLKDKNT